MITLTTVEWILVLFFFCVSNRVHSKYLLLMDTDEVPAVAIRLLELINVKSLVAFEWQFSVYMFVGSVYMGINS